MSRTEFTTERLLNTEEAARFLRVSQASIRRWSNAGLLPAQRLGGRRERRFRESDLLLFMDRSEQTGGGSREVNVGGLSVPVPSHFGPVSTTDDGRLRLTVPFLAEGLQMGQPCFLVALGEILDAYMESLAQAGVDVAAAQRNGRLTLVRFTGGTVDGVLAQWERYFADILARGPAVIRIVGEMTCEREMFVSEDEMLRYEEAFEVMVQRYPAIVLCQYDARHFDGATLVRALKAHPDMYGFRIGTFLN